MDMQQCVGCRFMKYCSKKCQKKNWKTHKACCGAISTAFAGQKSDKQVYYGFLDEAEYARWRDALMSRPNVLDPRAMAVTRTFMQMDENGDVREVH